MQHLMHDLKFAWRQCLKHPASSALIILTLALGIGANTAMFSVVYHVFLAPLPYTDGERLVRLEQNGLDYYPIDAPWSDLTVNDYRQQSTVFSHLVEYTQGIYTIVGQGEPWQANLGFVSNDYFEMLGVKPLLGRGFTREDEADGSEAVMLLSHEVWRNRFAADSSVIGLTVEISRISYRVIGVLPPLPPYPHANDAWIPAIHDPFRVHDYTDAADNRASGYVLNVFAKLNATSSIEMATVDVNAIATRLAHAYPDVYTGDYALTLKPLQQEMADNSFAPFGLMFGLTCLVMLIASANVANLLLARMLNRVQELAIREAVGATPGRIRRQVLMESLFFALVGGAVALFITQPSLRLLSNYVSRYSPLAQMIQVDAALLLFVFMSALATGLLSGRFAFIRGWDMNTALKEGSDKNTVSSTGAWRRQFLLLTQFSLSVVMLTTSALIVLSLYRLSQQDAGYDSTGVLELSALVNQDLAASSTERLAHLRNLGQQLRVRTAALPGVEASGLFGGAPLLQDVSWLRATMFDLDDPADAGPSQSLSTRINFVSADWFEVMDIALLRGRPFEGANLERPEAIVNASLAERFFPAGDAVGKIIRYAGTEFELPIVGVVENFRSRNLGLDDEPAVYFQRESPTDALNFYVRSSGDLDELATTLRTIVRDLDPRQSVMRLMPLEDIRTESLAPIRLRTLLIVLSGLLALIVTLSGVAGVVAYNISQRVRETGIHMAVGASPAKITGMFVRQGFRTYLCGLAIGMVLALSIAPLLEPMLYETSAFNPGIYAAVSLLLTLVVLLALYLPARRAGMLTPMEALHAE